MTGLLLCDACSLKTLRSAGDLKTYLVTFVQALVPFADDLFEMHKNVFAGFACNKTVALGSVEPFHCPFFHGTHPFRLCKSATGGHGHVHPTVFSKNTKSQPGLSCTMVAIPLTAQQGQLQCTMYYDRQDPDQ